MNTNASSIFRILLGGLLTYQGVKICREVLAAKPENYLLYCAIGAVFAIVGAVFLLRELRVYMKNVKEQADAHEEALKQIEKEKRENEKQNEE